MSAEEDRLFPAFIKVFVEKGIMKVEIIVSEDDDFKKILALHKEIVKKNEMNGFTDNNYCAIYWDEVGERISLISSLFCFEDGVVNIRAGKLVSIKDLFK